MTINIGEQIIRSHKLRLAKKLKAGSVVIEKTVKSSANELEIRKIVKKNILNIS